jgi:tetratricopeptide (TPR) repeat protein
MSHYRNSHFAILLTIVAAIPLQASEPASVRPAASQTPQAAAPVADESANANDAYQAKDWPKAAQLYGQIASQQPQNALALYRSAVSLQGLGKDEEAIAAYQKSIQAGVPPGIGEYGIALAYASRHDTENAFQCLQKAAQDGFTQPDRLAGDQELAALRSDPRFAKVVEQVTHNAKPCAYNPLNRQFDFWIGEWDVVGADGSSPAGASKIELILGDCVIQENWTSAGNIGYEGKSYNTYNPDLHRWEQFWNDNAGGMIHFYGELKDGVMDYWTDEIPQKDGTRLKRHLQFIPSGHDKVRQFSQGSTDGGKTWHVEYDFIYNRKK